MASLKRRIASTQVKMRRKQQDKEEKELLRLQAQRNKALRDAKIAIRKAQALENKKDAQLKKSQAKARLNRARRASGQVTLNSLISGGRKLLRDLQGKPERRNTKRGKG